MAMKVVHEGGNQGGDECGDEGDGESGGGRVEGCEIKSIHEQWQS